MLKTCPRIPVGLPGPGAWESLVPAEQATAPDT
jgi:hypothetical protein